MTEPVVPDTTSDERAVGWGDDLDDAAERDSDDERLREDRPPHYDRD
jgi:hypothetical protein